MNGLLARWALVISCRSNHIVAKLARGRIGENLPTGQYLPILSAELHFRLTSTPAPQAFKNNGFPLSANRQVNGFRLVWNLQLLK
ncbi:MAG: hypothetical protein WBS20_14135 [Lysobacterales bacterium]